MLKTYTLDISPFAPTFNASAKLTLSLEPPILLIAKYVSDQFHSRDPLPEQGFARSAFWACAFELPGCRHSDYRACFFLLFIVFSFIFRIVENIDQPRFKDDP